MLKAVTGGSGGGGVTSFNTRTGAVTPQSGDYTAAQVTGAEQTANKNVANGYAGLDASGNLIGTIVIREDTAANLASVVLALGQLGYATDTFKFVVGDGATTFANIPGQQIASKTAGFLGSTYGNGTTFPTAPGKQSMAFGMGTATGINSGAVGGLSIAQTGFGSDIFPTANGNASFAIGAGTAQGQASFSGGYGFAVGKGAASIGGGGFALGQFACAVNLGSFGLTQTDFFPSASSITSSTCTITFLFQNFLDRLANGMAVNIIGADASGNVINLDGIISSLAHATNTTMTFTTSDTTIANMVAGTIQFRVTSYGGFASGFGYGVQPNAKMHSCSITTAQHGIANLRANTTGATLTEMTYDAAAPAGTIVGVVNNSTPSGGNTATFISNRFILQSGVSYAVTLTVHGKQSGSANNYMAKRMFVMANIGGTMSISSIQTIGTDINASTWGGLTAPQMDNTNKSLQVQVTGVAATTINWNAIVEWSEISVA